MSTISGLTTDQIAALSTAAIAGLSTTDIRELSVAQTWPACRQPSWQP